MALSVSPVEMKDVDTLVRKVEFPAHTNGPLHRLMFSRETEQRLDYAEDEIKWTINGIYDTIGLEDEFLYKACGPDGLPVGLIGWTINLGTPLSKEKSGQKRQERKKKHDIWTPPSLDISTWLRVSRMLRMERQRVCQEWQGNGICRITFMAVDPNYQRQGVGSTLLKMLCDHVDDNGLAIFVLSSPEGVKLYSKFGFQEVGLVSTEQGSFTSMLRT